MKTLTTVSFGLAAAFFLLVGRVYSGLDRTRTTHAASRSRALSGKFSALHSLPPA